MSNSNIQNDITPLLIDVQEGIFFLEKGNVPQALQQLLSMRRKIRDALNMGKIFFFEPDQSLLDIYVESLQSKHSVEGFWEYHHFKSRLTDSIQKRKIPFLLICSLTQDVCDDLLPFLRMQEQSMRLFLTSGNIESMRLYKDQVSTRLLPKPFSIQFLHALIEQEIRIWEMSVCGFSS